MARTSQEVNQPGGETQVCREGGVVEVSYPGPRNIWGSPAIGQKYKVCQNVPF